ncbi:CENP-Q, a CENPA-CAD centromere complex subunit-domain-containing protein [Hypoxylon sp. FL1150]|nr:CENP-Q, a CENPA-CAD centromere complex subunit-domain-containing protein [Hypoxylon sp. FL1150]
MAPEVANQKRKRGRPTNASRDDDEGDASGTQTKLTRQGQVATASKNTRDPDMDESSRPRKRGRPVNTEPSFQAQPEQQPEATQSSKAKRRRRQSPETHTSGGRDNEREEEPEQAPEPENTQRKKRGRPRVSNEDKQNEQRDNTTTASEKTLAKKRGRPAKDKEVAAEEADDENEGDSSILRRSGRVRRSLDNGREIPRPASEQGPSNKKSKEGGKRGRPPLGLGEQSTGEAESESVPQSKRKRGRPSLNSQIPADEEANAEPQPQPKKRGRPSLSGEHGAPSSKEKGRRSRGRPSPDQEAPEEEGHPTRGRPRLSNKEQAKQRRNRQSSEIQNRSSSPESGASPPRYRHLTTRTRRVPRNVIESKWTPLEAPTLSSVAALLQSATRPVLLRLDNAQRHAQAQAVLTAVSNRLRSKMARGLPFPPATTATRREEEFEFERTISGVQALESQLDPLLHGVELLRREKERAEKELDREYKVLSRLSSNARAEARERREQMRKMHVLVQERPPESKTEDVCEILPAEKGTGRVFSHLQDEELSGVAGQIANHMESMRGNLQQMDGVVPAIAKSQGLLRATLQAHLDREQLESVILG